MFLGVYVNKKLAMCLTLGVWVIPVASANVELDALCSCLQEKLWMLCIVFTDGQW